MLQEQIIENCKKCPNFLTCSKNFCPLDLELEIRTGKIDDMCRWMRECRKKKIKGLEFVSGGNVMPDRLLEYVPVKNFKWLNKASQKRWDEVNK